MNSTPHLLVVADTREKNIIAEMLAAFDARCHVVHSLEDLGKTPPRSEFHGMMVDLHSFFKIPLKVREYFKEHTHALPTLKVYIDPQKKTFVINKLTKNDNHAQSLQNFISDCAETQPRKIRRAQRHKIFLNVTLDEQMSNTADISRNGCFIFTTGETFKPGDEIFVRFLELGDQTPIPCTIMRKAQWGAKFAPAGIGVDFISMTEPQRIELESIFLEHHEKKDALMELNCNEMG
ncbi:MAG: PilZ domain-containing protein [Desulfuromonadales bacterium]|nr:PilZ domain-containing protein [Desulfuromonadales bacterium]